MTCTLRAVSNIKCKMSQFFDAFRTALTRGAGAQSSFLPAGHEGSTRTLALPCARARWTQTPCKRLQLHRLLRKQLS
jgi:hypothetical protein